MMAKRLGAAAALLMVLGMTSVRGQSASTSDFVWIEGEKPVQSNMHRHPWWYDKVRRDLLSGGDFVSNWSEKEPGEASYRANVSKAGEYEFWVRANPLQSKLSYRLNDGKWTPIDLSKDQQGNTNVAEDGKPDLRFVAWSRVGKVHLNQGTNFVRFRMDSENNNHGYLDCFVFSAAPFAPNGTMKPGQTAEYARRAAAENQGWFALRPPPIDFLPPVASISARSTRNRPAMVDLSASRMAASSIRKPSTPVRFWAVNGPPGKDREALGARRKSLPSTA